MEFTWETNPARRGVQGSYLVLPSRPDVLVEPSPGADACRFIWTGQHPVYHIFLKLMRAAGGLAWRGGEGGGRATLLSTLPTSSQAE